MRHKIKRQVDRVNGPKLAAVFIVAIGLIAATVIVRSRETAAADLKLCHLQQPGPERAAQHPRVGP